MINPCWNRCPHLVGSNEWKWFRFCGVHYGHNDSISDDSIFMPCYLKTIFQNYKWIRFTCEARIEWNRCFANIIANTFFWPLLVRRCASLCCVRRLCVPPPQSVLYALRRVSYSCMSSPPNQQHFSSNSIVCLPTATAMAPETELWIHKLVCLLTENWKFVFCVVYYVYYYILL